MRLSWVVLVLAVSLPTSLRSFMLPCIPPCFSASPSAFLHHSHRPSLPDRLSAFLQYFRRCFQPICIPLCFSTLICALLHPSLPLYLPLSLSVTLLASLPAFTFLSTPLSIPLSVFASRAALLHLFLPLSVLHHAASLLDSLCAFQPVRIAPRLSASGPVVWLSRGPVVWLGWGPIMRLS